MLQLLGQPAPGLGPIGENIMLEQVEHQAASSLPTGLTNQARASPINVSRASRLFEEMRLAGYDLQPRFAVQGAQGSLGRVEHGTIVAGEPGRSAP
jgi:hypothetical protein